MSNAPRRKSRKKPAAQEPAPADPTDKLVISVVGTALGDDKPARDVVIVYLGALAPFKADDVARHPELKDYPVMELALEKTLSKTVRYASLYRVVSGFLGFGDPRVKTAAVESAAPALTVLHGISSPPRGQYAVACETDSYEVRVE